MMKHLFLFVLASILLTACSTPYVVRLDPQEESNTYRYGEKLLSKGNGRTKVTVSYYDSSPKYVVFNLGIDNTGGSAFNFDPADCLLLGDAGPVQKAIDPEVQLLAADFQSIKDYRFDEFTRLSGVALNLATAIVIGTAEGEPVDPLFYGQVAANTVTDLTFALENTNPANNIVRGITAPLDGAAPGPDSRYFWLDHTLRITTIGPGQGAFGKIAFERNDVAQNLVFKVFVEGEEFTFPFNQKLLKQ
ncbi:MAG: hypothetical protein AB8H12_15820 [Lewinella sp.]